MQEMNFSMLRAAFQCIAQIHWQMARPMTPDKAWKDQFVILEPGADNLYENVARDTFIKPEPLPAIWYPYRPKATEVQDNKRVVMYLHSSAYTTGSYDPLAVGVVCNVLAGKLSGFILSAGHRKSSTPGWHFPAQLQDAISTYTHLLNQGVKPGNIILLGSSSGGHLMFNLLRYIIEHPSTGLPKPAASAVSSPWIDLRTMDYTSYHSRSNYLKDYIDMPFISCCRNTFIPPGVNVAEPPYLSIKHHPFDLEFVLAWMSVSEDEVPLVDLLEFAERMQKVSGNKFELFVCPDAPHDVMWTGAKLGFLEESKVCCDKLRGFLEENGV